MQDNKSNIQYKKWCIYWQLGRIRTKVTFRGSCS